MLLTPSVWEHIENYLTLYFMCRGGFFVGTPFCNWTTISSGKTNWRLNILYSLSHLVQFSVMVTRFFFCLGLTLCKSSCCLCQQWPWHFLLSFFTITFLSLFWLREIYSDKNKCQVFVRFDWMLVRNSSDTNPHTLPENSTTLMRYRTRPTVNMSRCVCIYK